MHKKLLEKLEALKLPDNTYNFWQADINLLKRVVKCRSIDVNIRLEALQYLLVTRRVSARRFVYFQLKNDYQLRRKFVEVTSVDEERLEELIDDAAHFNVTINPFRLLTNVDKIMLTLTNPHIIRKLP